MIFLLSLLFTLISQPTMAFVLISPGYRLSDPSNTTVNIANGACRANGVSDEELSSAISTTITWWNEIPGSSLILKKGGEVSRNVMDTPNPGEILVGCFPLGNANGITFNSEENGSAAIALNANTLVPGGYLPGAIESTLVHEMGHALGLHHSDDPASVMTYRNHDWFLPSSLSEDDKDGVRYLYPTDPNLLLFGGCSALAGTPNHNQPFLSLKGLSGDFIFVFLVWLIVFIRRKVW